jgi:hypothetical protein
MCVRKQTLPRPTLNWQHCTNGTWSKSLQVCVAQQVCSCMLASRCAFQAAFGAVLGTSSWLLKHIAFKSRAEPL